jgi:hypothetical protein
MKKLLAMASLLCVLALASCRKDYVCDCAGVDGNKTLIQQYDQKLNEARMECDDHDEELTSTGERKFTDCTLR